MRPLVFAILGTAVAVVVACSGDEQTPPAHATAGDGGSESVEGTSGGGGGQEAVTATTASEFCEKTFGLTLAAVESCCSEENKATAAYERGHAAAATAKATCTSLLVASATASRLRTDAYNAANCYSAYANLIGPTHCASLAAPADDSASGECAEVIVGTRGDGESCTGDHECIDGLLCAGYTESQEGACASPPALGQPCGGAGGLDLGLGTHPSCEDGAHCEAAVCVAGDPPERGAAGARCRTSADCALGTYCDAADGAGTCSLYCGSR